MRELLCDFPVTLIWCSLINIMIIECYDYNVSVFFYVVMQAAVCQPEQFEGHQLGQFTVAATHPGPLLPVLAGENPLRAGAAAGSPDYSPADQQAGGTLEGIVNATVFSAVVWESFV